MTEPSARTLAPRPALLALVTPTPTGPAAHGPQPCPGCISLGQTSQFGDYSPRHDQTITLSACRPGPHDPARQDVLLMWSGDTSGARGVLPMAHHGGTHPYFELALTRYTCLPPLPPAQPHTVTPPARTGIVAA